MMGLWRRLFTNSALWSGMALVVAGVIAVAAVVTTDTEPRKVVDNPLVFVNSEPVPDGHWSVLCIDGLAYLEVASARGHAVLPKYRKNGLLERCALPAGE
jgi:hypothetical protein